MSFFDFLVLAELRAILTTPGLSQTARYTPPPTPHCDIVYMGRGTKNLYTAWIPYGDVPSYMGGLMLLENSHKLHHLKAGYGSTDVDLYCENKDDAQTIVERARAEGRNLTNQERSAVKWNSTGSYSSNAIATRKELGGRWLVSEYEMGDLLIFSMYTCTLSDNPPNNPHIIRPRDINSHRNPLTNAGLATTRPPMAFAQNAGWCVE